ncbi:MAG: DUF2147 domain-containing protein [Bacteroidetes bacterium]|nr:DUF2147 domain-containing protein [Bacteroidota bacterium]
MQKPILKPFILAILLLFSGLAKAQKPDSKDIIGTWLTASGKAKVQIYAEGGHFNGKIVWLKNPTYEDGKPKVDKHNPDKANQTKPLMGLNMLKGFVFDEDQWNDGTIYDPENGKTYSCKIEIRDGNKLDVRGYIGFSLIGRTETWFRVQDIK